MTPSDPRLSAWVAANAGAGKTHTLANRVTRLLLAGAPPERILCLTYTKAAAAEMFERLFNQLGQWSMLSDSALAEKITAVGADPGGKEDLRAARRLFAKALETPGGLKIQTIHAFCQYVLKRFPLEAGVPASFRVLDDRSAADLMALARARVFERQDVTLQAAIAHLATHMADKRLNEILDAALGADRGKLNAVFEKLGGPESDWSAQLKTAHGARADDTPSSIAKEFRNGLDESTMRAIAAWLNGGTAAEQKRAAELAAALAISDPSGSFEALRPIFLTAKNELRAKLFSDKLCNKNPELAGHLLRIGSEVLQALDRLHAVEAAALAEATLTVVDAVREVYASEKRARALLDYDDLITRTHGLLHKTGPAWVLYKLDQGIDHVLIDEAQDTSALQWDIIAKLTEEFFAGEGASQAERTLFAVGDEKQSIFSFQGADPAQFATRRDYFENKARQGERPFLVKPLQDSWRSAPQVLDFVDAVFANPAARDGLTSSEAPIKHNAVKTALKGCVEVWPTHKPAQTPERDPYELARPIDREAEASPVVRLAVEIADRIKSWLQTGAALPGHTQAIRPRDVMILLPKREPFGSEIIRRLKERGVPVAGADRIVLTEQIAVMDLIALGRFVLLPEDDLNLAALLRSPLLGLSEDDVFALAHGRSGRLWDSLQTREGDYPQAIAFLKKARARADFTPPFEFYAEILIEGRKKLLKRLGQEAGDAIDEFLSLALQFETAEAPSLEGFLAWIEQGGAEIKRDMERGHDEVRVMTVHGAKGLEADIVILPDTTREPSDPTGKGQMLYTEDGVLFPMPKDKAPLPVTAAKEAAKEAMMKEHRRLLYVALTRAKERLILCGFENKKGLKPGSWHALAEPAAAQLGTANENGALTYGSEALVRLAPVASAASEDIPLPSWATTAAQAEQAAPWLIRPSEAAGMDEPPPASPRHSVHAARRGQLVHTLLAALPERPPVERGEAALRYLLARGIETAEAETLTAEVLAVLDDPRFAAAFGPGSRAEVALVADLPEFAPTARAHGRIDRLAVSDDWVLIVDFKTGRPIASESDVPALYATQMALYGAAAARIFPGKRIDCALLWVEGPSLLPLSPGFLEMQCAQVCARLESGPLAS